MMTISEAVESVKNGIRVGVRGVGCATICMADDREYHLVSEHGPPLLMRVSQEGELLERLPATEVCGEVKSISWSVDELGGIYTAE